MAGTILEDRRITFQREQKKESTLAGEDDLMDALRTHFGITLEGHFRKPISG
ncbi:MAG: hypothetical protein V1755_10370 [Chloroflexota bacterium]